MGTWARIELILVARFFSLSLSDSFCVILLLAVPILYGLIFDIIFFIFYKSRSYPAQF